MFDREDFFCGNSCDISPAAAAAGGRGSRLLNRISGVKSKLWSAVVCCLFMLVSGCTSAAVDPDFAAVAGQLESGGSYYRISDNREFFRTAESLFLQAERSFTENAASPESEKVMMAAAALRLAVKYSGISECRWSGASSVKLGDVIETTYRNKNFYLLPENPSGVIWQLPGKVNRSLFAELAGLPADTILAGDFILDLRKTGELLAASKNGGLPLEPQLRMIFNAGIKDLFYSLSGEWGVAVFPSRDNPEKNEFVFTVPDEKLYLFKAASRWGKRFPGAAVEKNMVSLRLPGSHFSPVILGGDGRVTVFSSTYARDHFLSSKTKLSSQPDFKRLCTGLPENGLAVFYSAGIRPETRTVSLDLPGGAVMLDPALFERAQMFVVVREKNGISVTSNSGFDLQSADFVNLIVQPAVILLTHWKDIVEYFPSKPVDAHKKTAVPRGSSPQYGDETGCRKNIEKIASAFAAYKKKHGSMPVQMDIEGLRKILADGKISTRDLICPGTGDAAVPESGLLDFNSCSYIYWGSWQKNANPKLPLLIDRPENHRDRFHILFNDGSIELMSLANCRSFRRVAGFLHTRYLYSEEDFRELIRRAAELDRLFEKR